jgi:hypothetical protein
MFISVDYVMGMMESTRWRGKTFEHGWKGHDIEIAAAD